MGSSLDDIVGGTAGGDDEVEIDYSGAVDFEALPKGRYAAKVLSCEAGKSEKGNPKLDWKFVITAEGFVGRQVRRSTPTTGKGSGITKQMMKALGFDTEGAKVKFSPSKAVDLECEVELIIDPKNDDFNEVKRVYPPEAKSSSSQLG